MEQTSIDKALPYYTVFKQSNDQKKEMGINDYSLLNSISKIHDEVRLHSRFIFSMINPESNHYCGRAFLKPFLEILGIELKLENAVVEKEKGGIDLLIKEMNGDEKNSNRFIIIENKINAPDAKYQITRYIKQVIDNKDNNLDPKVDLSKNITIVYLSHRKSKPSDESMSHIRFNLVEDQGSKHLKWDDTDKYYNSEIKPEDKSKIEMQLSPDTKFLYFHMNYVNQVKRWVIACKQWLVTSHPNNLTLLHAFEEYEKIINRLDRSISWRKIDSLASYSLRLDESLQKDMYEAMVDAQYVDKNSGNSEFINEASHKNFGLNEYVILKLMREIDVLFPENIYERIPIIYPKVSEKPLKLIRTTNLRKWINEKGIKKNWKNIGFTIDDGGDKFTLCFGQKYLYFGKGDNDIFHEDKRVGTKGNNHKKNWLKNKKLPDIIAVLKKRKSFLMRGPSDSR